MLSTADYERIKQNARISAEEEFKNHQKILVQQKNCQLAKAKAHIEQLKQIDKKRPKYPLTQGEKEKKIQGNSILYAAKKAKDFALADQIRDELKAAGIELTDIPNGVRWKRI